MPLIKFGNNLLHSLSKVLFRLTLYIEPVLSVNSSSVKVEEEGGDSVRLLLLLLFF